MIFKKNRPVPRQGATLPYPLANISPTELPEMISELQLRFERVKADTAFLDLRRSEYHPDSYFSVTGIMNAGEQLCIEKSLLCGRALMIQEMVCRKKLCLDSASRQVLRRVLDYAGKLQ